VLRKFEIHYSVLNIFHHYTRLACYLVPEGQRDLWMHLVPFFHVDSPIDYETPGRDGLDRDAYNHRMFERVAQTLRTVCAERNGFYDFFVPVIRERRCIAFVVSGIVLKSVPDKESLMRRWEAWTGNRPAPGSGEFNLFLRAVLDTPVLPPETFRAHREMLEILAASVADTAASERRLARVDWLKNNVFARNLPHVNWMKFVTSRSPKASQLYWKSKEVTAWEREEIGLRRPPTTIAAFAPAGSMDPEQDDWSSLLLMKRIQVEMFRTIRQWPDMVGAPLEDSGLLVALSADPAKAPRLARLEVRDKVRQVIQRVRKRYGVQMAAGVGVSVSPGEFLGPSFHGALDALRWCLYQGKEAVFDEEQPAHKTASFGDLRELSNQVSETLGQGNRAALELAVDRYLKAVLWFSGKRAETVRLFLWHTLWDCRKKVEGLLPIEPPVESRVDPGFEAEMNLSVSVPFMFRKFRGYLSDFAALLSDPPKIKRKAGVRWARRFIEGHFREPLTLAQVAARVGVSTRTLGEGLFSETGMRFNELLRKKRAEEARRLLSRGQLTLSRVATESGFSSASYLVRSYKRVFKNTPRGGGGVVKTL